MSFKIIREGSLMLLQSPGMIFTPKMDFLISSQSSCRCSCWYVKKSGSLLGNYYYLFYSWMHILSVSPFQRGYAKHNYLGKISSVDLQENNWLLAAWRDSFGCLYVDTALESLGLLAAFSKGSAECRGPQWQRNKFEQKQCSSQEDNLELSFGCFWCCGLWCCVCFVTFLSLENVSFKSFFVWLHTVFVSNVGLSFDSPPVVPSCDLQKLRLICVHCDQQIPGKHWPEAN